MSERKLASIRRIDATKDIPDADREGLVFKSLTGHDSFKSISAEWLLKKG